MTPQKVYVEVDLDKKAYVILPDGSVLTSTSGIINTTWIGVAGSITLIKPKVTSKFSISESAFIGDLETKSAYLNCDSCRSLTSISAPKATTLFGSNCISLTSISAQKATTLFGNNCISLTTSSIYSILDNAYSLFLKGELNGILNFSGTTSVIDVSKISPIHGISYNSIITSMVGWTITVNAA